MQNRRNFLKLFGIGVAATATVKSLPALELPKTKEPEAPWDETLSQFQGSENPLTIKLWEEALYRRAPNLAEYCRVHNLVMKSDTAHAFRLYRERALLGRAGMWGP